MIKAKTQELVEKRVTKGWSKADLARKANLQHSSIVRTEQGKGTSPKTAKAIADALGVPVTELFTVSVSKEA